MLKRIALTLTLLLSASLGNIPASAAQDKQTILVTGANRGIGLELARQLTAQGHAVIGTARKPGAASDLKTLGVRVEQLDVTDSASVAALGERLQGVKIDVLINNAGISGHNAASFRETDFDQIGLTFDVNSTGPMRVTQSLLGNLSAGKGKTVIQISSIMGSIENNGGGYYGYRASKSALNMLNKSLAQELAAEGFVCVVLHPGWVRTRMGGAGADITPQQSVAGMLKVMATLDEKDNGHFYDYQGKELPW